MGIKIGWKKREELTRSNPPTTEQQKKKMAAQLHDGKVIECGQGGEKGSDWAQVAELKGKLIAYEDEMRATKEKVAILGE